MSELERIVPRNILVLAPTKVCAEVIMRENDYVPRQWTYVSQYSQLLSHLHPGIAKVILVGDWWMKFRGFEPDHIYDRLSHEASCGRVKLEYLSA